VKERMAKIINGKKIAEEIKIELKKRVEHLKKRGTEPRLTIILVGNRPDCKIYAESKQKACEEIGIKSDLHVFPENIKEEKLINSIDVLNDDDSVHGIIVEMPLPKNLNEKTILREISPMKDVDGLNPITIGNLSIGNEFLVPATPKGIIRLLEKIDIPVEGKEIVIVNNSNVVGKPLALLLTNRFATVTICHVKTKDLKEHTSKADILITAVGTPNLIKRDMIKKGAVVIDAGIKRVDDKIIGDVDFEKVKDIVSYITPVPGGVGPMTVAMILENTIIMAESLTI
jgi:methylenetetrahydrofolate dehydrogenase (NADP+)/methenyltetrahydrofolate cyclohydrolase